MAPVPELPMGNSSDHFRRTGIARRSITRTVEQCERYLGRLSIVMRRAGRERNAFLPIARRLLKELEEARRDQEIIDALDVRAADWSVSCRHNPCEPDGSARHLPSARSGSGP